jgi:hypothetical protein
MRQYGSERALCFQAPAVLWQLPTMLSSAWLSDAVSCAQPASKTLIAEATHALISLSRTARSVIADLTR